MDLNDKTLDRIKFTPGSKIFEIGEQGLSSCKGKWKLPGPMTKARA